MCVCVTITAATGNTKRQKPGERVWRKIERGRKGEKLRFKKESKREILRKYQGIAGKEEDTRQRKRSKKVETVFTCCLQLDYLARLV